MLTRLLVSNYALIDKLDLSLEEGFTVITGETGSGKSILLGALGLITGERADTQVLQKGKSKCVVEGTFRVGLSLKSFFDENDLDYLENTVVRREINDSGKSRAFINDTPVTLSQLKEFSALLIDIHSQFEVITIGKPEYRVRTLDAYAGNKPLLDEYRVNYQEYLTVKKRLNELTQLESGCRTDEDYLRFQLQEMEEVGVGIHDFTQLEEDFNLQTHAGEIKTTLAEVIQHLSGDYGSVSLALRDTLQKLSKISTRSQSLSEVYQRLNSALIEIKDIESELTHQLDKTEVDQVVLETLSVQLDKYNSLLLKHRVQNPEELIALKQTWEEKLNSLGSLEEEIAAAQKQLDRLKETLVSLSEKLSQSRGQAAKSFQQKTTEMLAELAMPHAQFVVQVQTLSDFGTLGRDEVLFQFSANKGSVLQPIQKVASGGELSRVLLCIKALASRSALIPTLIFDEIDTGVSGEVAGKMGRIMQKMGANMQLICITHLPQVAGMGSAHLKVYKETQTHTTVTHIAQLSSSDRITELAKMLSGEKITEAAVEHAKALLVG
ncbi:MAG: DNA repair protein RecN [Flavobacteriales bacterium]